MMIDADFSNLEILKIAISIEEEGMEFYKSASLYAKDSVKDFLLNTAEQEMLHKKKFEEFYRNFATLSENDNDFYIFDEQVVPYFKQFIKNQVFEKKSLDKDMFKDLKKVVEYALEAENSAIELYTRMYNNVKHEEFKLTLELLINEERSHYTYLSNLIKELNQH